MPDDQALHCAVARLCLGCDAARHRVLSARRVVDQPESAAGEPQPRHVVSSTVPAPRFHPKLAELYRLQVAELHIALNDPDARTEAAEILRTLVERITVRSDANGHVVVLTGRWRCGLDKLPQLGLLAL